MSAINSHDGRDLQLVAVLSNGQDSDMSNGAEGLSFGLGGLITNIHLPRYTLRIYSISPSIYAKKIAEGFMKSAAQVFTNATAVPSSTPSFEQLLTRYSLVPVVMVPR